MSKNQLHGKIYEDYIKSVYMGASDHGRLNNCYWDIEKQYDKINYIATSIKTTNNDIICLADARRFWNIKEEYRLLIGKYYQTPNIKIFINLMEFFISIDEHLSLLGNISFNEIENFHKLLLSYKFGEHKQCQKIAKNINFNLKSRSIIKLNPKIDSKLQRRLQCSINVNDLFKNIKLYNIFNENDFYRGISVNFKIQSGCREFGAK